MRKKGAIMRTMQVKNGNYWFFLEGEWVIIPKEWLGQAEPKKAESIIRLYDANRKSQERESRCRKSNGARCMEKCGECEYFRSGLATSLDLLLENGAEAVSTFSVEGYVIAQERNHALADAISMLSLEDQQILRSLAEGLPERKIGERLGKSQKTINNRREKIRKKLESILESPYEK